MRSSDDHASELAAELAAEFAAAFEGARARFEVRAPGRVNLIGEHVDYNGLPVLPMAIQRGVVLVGRERRDARVRLRNTDERFPAREFELTELIEPSPRGDWCNYVKASAQALARERGAEFGADLFVTSDLPDAAGLSSSSALAVAAGLALAHANGLDVERLRFAELMTRAERYVGTHSGGMDQAICLLATAGSAARIGFEPLTCSPVRMPDDWRIVVAHSLVRADKSGAARDAYNTRRAQCEDALAAMLVDRELREGPRTLRALLEGLGAERVSAIAARTLDGVLLARMRHQISEYERVLQAERALELGDAERFGALMDQSHASLATDYEVSHAALDELVAAARRGGALGARLTGAGFGGCAIALVRAANADALCDELRRTYYASRAEPSFEALFVARASDGARVRAFAG